MNKERRKRLKEAAAALSEAYDIIDEVKSEEAEAYDNLPEGIQYGERGEQMAANVDTLEDILSSIEDAQEAIEEL